ncbi:MAG: substrate-binding domain-containing protein, partial [Ferruginibacter sp.]
MNLRFGKLVFVFAPVLILMQWSCKPQANKNLMYDSPSHGSINITVDESFRPVIEEQIAMYQESYPGTFINAKYKTEAECFKDFFRDTSNRVIIVTRRLVEKEEKYMKDSLNYFPGFDLVATDAIAIVLHKDNPDTLFTLSRLREQLMGKINREQKIVFDGLSATSNVRFVVDSILKGAPFDTAIVKAAKTSKEVLEFVAADSRAIGFVGINWIGNPEVKEQVEMLKKVKLAYVECSVCNNTPFVKP